MRYQSFILKALIIVLLSGVTITSAQTEETEVPTVEQLEVEVIEVYPHDRTSFTQGLVFANGILYETAGQYGTSRTRKVEPKTGEVIKEVDYTDEYAATGLALVDDRLIQLTWREGRAFFFDEETLSLLGFYLYNIQGAGMCYDGEFLWVSAGSDKLYRRDPVSFKQLDILFVTLGDKALPNINELECVGDSIYANIHPLDSLVRIDKTTGEVTAIIDASTLLTAREKDDLIPELEVLNGIAYDPEEEVFYLTGKHWEKMFVVRFVPMTEE